jgi:hypothetical protein
MAIFALALFLAAVLLLMNWLLGYFASAPADHSSRPQMVSQRAEQPAQPLHLADLPDQLRALRTHENRTLHSYACVDPAEGLVRIPIDVAIELYAKQLAGITTPDVGGDDNSRGRAAPSDEP